MLIDVLWIEWSEIFNRSAINVDSFYSLPLFSWDYVTVQNWRRTNAVYFVFFSRLPNDKSDAFG